MSVREQSMPLVSIVVVNWNGNDYLTDCLESLESQSWPNKEMILVDNGSTDGSTDIIRKWSTDHSNVQTIYLNENTGFTKANNLAFEKARGEWIALFNNDAVAESHWLEKLVKRGNLDKRIGMLGSKILFHSSRVIDKAGHLIYWDGLNRGRGTMEEDNGQFDQEEEIIWPDACAALYHRRLLSETGGFDESFFAYGDDADLGMRARLLGWKGRYVPEAVVFHRHSATAGAYSPLKVMLVERNRLLLAIKNFPLSLLCQNPYWTLRRYLWQVYGALGKKGSAGRFVEEHGRLRLLANLVWSYLSAMKKLRSALVARRSIQKNKRLSKQEVMALLRRFQIDVKELTLRD